MGLIILIIIAGIADLIFKTPVKIPDSSLHSHTRNHQTCW